jgi:hypothetical protein
MQSSLSSAHKVDLKVLVLVVDVDSISLFVLPLIC